MTDLVTYHRPDDMPRTAVITLDSPANRNALSLSLLSQLRQHLDTAAQDDTIHAVLLRSSESVFCSGADLGEALDHGMGPASAAIVAVMRDIAALPVPVVAQIVGPVRAGGLGIVAACDVAVSSDAATFAFTEARLGLAPAIVSLTVLPVLTRRAASLNFLTAATFDGVAAESWGLVTVAVPADEVIPTVNGIIEDISRCSRQGLRESKALLSAPLLRDIDDLGEDLAERSAQLFASDEAQKAMSTLMARA